MALQVWLPLNGNLDNQGLTKISVINTGTTIDNNGKIGKCYTCTTSQNMEITNLDFSSLSSCSISFWLKVTAKGGSGWLPFTGQTTSYYIMATSAGTGAFYHNNVGSGQKIYKDGILNTTPGALNEWHHYCITGVNLSTWTKFYINKYSSAWNFAGSINDVRIYDHCLSPKEVHEIAKGLVIHYPLDSNNISLSPNLITGFVNGGQTTISGNNIVISGNNSDTYFRIKTSKTLTLNKQYKLSCIGTGFSNNSYYNFPIAAQSNTSPGVIKIQNGYCELVFIANETIVNAGTTILMDDYSRSPSAGTIINIVLQEYDNIIYDCSGYKHHANVIGLLNFNNDSPRYNNCIKNTTEYPCKSMTSIDFPISSGLTICCWVNLTTWGNQISGLWATSNLSTDPTDYNTTACNHRDSGFDMRGTNGTTYRLTCNETDILVNTWKHVVVTHDGTNAKLYINGTLIRTLSLPSSLVAFNYIYLGYSKAGGVLRKCQGNWSDFRIYTTALSAEDIKELYDTPTFIDNQGDLLTNEFDEHLNNIIDLENYGIIKKQWLRGLTKYTQSNCQCTLENDGYKIYRPANLTTSANGNTMWGGFVLDNANNRFGLIDGHTYIIEFEVKGKSSNAAGIEWTNNVGWGGGGLVPAPTNVTIINPVSANFNSSEWQYFSYKWTISDTIYKTCTTAYSSFVAGQTYISYRHFKFGYAYTATGELGTDIYIRNIRMYDLTINTEILVNKTGIVDSGSFIEDSNETRFFRDKIIKSVQLLEI